MKVNRSWVVDYHILCCDPSGRIDPQNDSDNGDENAQELFEYHSHDYTIASGDRRTNTTDAPINPIAPAMSKAFRCFGLIWGELDDQSAIASHTARLTPDKRRNRTSRVLVPQMSSYSIYRASEITSECPVLLALSGPPFFAALRGSERLAPQSSRRRSRFHGDRRT
jgi:hypothetical protein